MADQEDLEYTASHYEQQTFKKTTQDNLTPNNANYIDLQNLDALQKQLNDYDVEQNETRHRKDGFQLNTKEFYQTHQNMNKITSEEHYMSDQD